MVKVMVFQDDNQALIQRAQWMASLVVDVEGENVKTISNRYGDDYAILTKDEFFNEILNHNKITKEALTEEESYQHERI
jgi:hypothetical protein